MKLFYANGNCIFLFRVVSVVFSNIYYNIYFELSITLNYSFKMVLFFI